MSSLAESDIGGASSLLTPQFSTDDGEENSEDAEGLQARFMDAVHRCQSRLKDADRRAIQQFQTVGQLQADLRAKQQQYSGGVVNRLITQMLPCLSVMGNLSVALVASLPSQRIETALLWGVLHLAVKSSIRSEKTLQSIVNILTQLDREMKKFEKYARALNETSDVRRVLVDMFESIIMFWVGAVAFLRKSGHVENIALETLWPDYSHEFHKTLHNVMDAVKTVYDEALLAKLPLFDDAILAEMDHEELTRFPCHILMERDICFHGRKDAQESIDSYLLESSVPNRLAIFTVYGIGGVGKSSLALTWANACKDRTIFDAIFWIQGETPISMRESFTKIANRLELSRPRQTEDHDTNVLLVKNWLSKTSKKWCLIYDNVEDESLLRDYLPLSSGPVLVTTRSKSVASGIGGMNKILELLPFDEESSLEVLQVRLKNDPQYINQSTAFSSEELEAARILLHKLGGLALGIEQMAAYISYRGYSIQEFVEKYNKMATHIHTKRHGMRAQHTLATVWALSFQGIKQASTDMDVYKLLGICAMLSPDMIQVNLLQYDVEQMPALEMSCCESEEGLEDALDILANAALIRREGAGFSMHRLVQRAFIDSLDKLKVQEVFSAAVALVDNVFPNQVNGLPLLDQWPACQDSIQHVVSLMNWFQNSQQSSKTKVALMTTEPLQRLSRNAAWYLFETGDYQDSLDLLEGAYKACSDKQSLGYAHLLGTKSSIDYELNRLGSSLSSGEECLKIRKNHLQDNDLELASSYSNMASTLSALSRQEEAIEYLRLTEEIESQAGEEAEVSLGITHMLTGRALLLQGNHPAARNRYNLSLGIFKRTLGGDSQLLAHLLFAMGNLELAIKDREKARQVYQEGYELSHKISATHILTASFLYKLGIIEMSDSQFSTAQDHLDRALTIAENRRMQGDTARVLHKISQLKLAMSGSAEAHREAISLMNNANSIRAGLQDGELLPDTDEGWDNLVCGYYR